MGGNIESGVTIGKNPRLVIARCVWEAEYSHE